MPNAHLFFIHTRVYAARQRLVTSCGSRGGSVQFAIENEAGLNIMPKALESRRYFDRKCFYRRMRFFIHQACCAAILRQYIPTLHRMAHASLVNEKTHPPIKILTVEISPRALGMMQIEHIAHNRTANCASILQTYCAIGAFWR